MTMETSTEGVSDFRKRLFNRKYTLNEETFERPPYNLSFVESYPTCDFIEDGKRFYTTPGGTYPSVTTVLGATKSDYAKKVLEDWQNGLGKEEADRQTKQAGERGSNIHNMMEDFIRGEYGSSLSTKSHLFKQMYPALKRIDNVRCLENPLWCNHLKLAGRVDCIADYDGVLSVIDFKTSTREKEAYEIEDYYLQVTAYARMMHHVYGVYPQQGVIIMCIDSLSVKEAKIFKIKIPDYNTKLEKRIKQYYAGE